MRRALLALAALGAVIAAALLARRTRQPSLEAPAADPPAPAFDDLLDELDPQPKERVLQLGLGSYELTFALAERLRGGRLEVFDDDQAAVDALAGRARERGLKNVSGWHGDPHEMLFEEGRFDRAILLRAPDDAVKRELERVLKPDGRYVAAFAAAG